MPCLEFKVTVLLAGCDLQSFCPMQSHIASRTSGARFCLGAVTPQMACFTAFSARTIYLWALGCVIGMLPIHKEGIWGSSEHIDRTITRVKISCSKYLLVIVLSEDCCNHIIGGSISPSETNCGAWIYSLFQSMTSVRNSVKVSLDVV